MDNSIPTQRPSPMVAAAGQRPEGVRRVVQVVVLPREPPAPQPGLGDGRRHRRKQLRRLAVWAGHGAACRVPAWLAEGPTRVPTCGRHARIGVSSCAGAQLRVPWPKGRRAQVWVAAWRGAASLASVLGASVHLCCRNGMPDCGAQTANTSQSSGHGKSEIQVTAGSAPGWVGGLSSCLPTTTFSPSPHMTTRQRSAGSFVSFKGTSPIRGARIHDFM